MCFQREVLPFFCVPQHNAEWSSEPRAARRVTGLRVTNLETAPPLPPPPLLPRCSLSTSAPKYLFRPKPEKHTGGGRGGGSDVLQYYSEGTLFLNSLLRTSRTK